MLPLIVVEVLEYQETNGQRPYAKWFNGLDAQAAAKVTTAIVRIGQGNFSQTKGVGAGVYEHTLDFGPGYRIYFGKDGERLVILLGGGTKRRQDEDIEIAKTRWQDYKKRKKQEKDNAANS